MQREYDVRLYAEAGHSFKDDAFSFLEGQRTTFLGYEAEVKSVFAEEGGQSVLFVLVQPK